MISNRQSPLIVSAAAAAKLPRWALLIVLATFALACFSGHAFWNSRDEQIFGLMWNMATGSASAWFLPTIAGTPYTATGPGIAWLGAALIKFLSLFAKPMILARVPSLLWFALATGSVWYATWHLARREEALPISMVFGQEASPRDYGRTVADSATLLFIATFGIVSRLHEIGLPIVLLALTGATLLGVIWSLVHLKAGSFVTGLSLGALALCTNLYWFIVESCTILTILCCVHAFAPFRTRRLLIIAATAAATFLVWPVGAILSGASFDAWYQSFARIQAAGFALPRAGSWLWMARNIVWYLCPIWPFALYAIYAWHRVIHRTHILLSIIALVFPLLFLFISGTAPEYTLTAMVVPTAILASFGIASLKTHSLKNILDWFSATIFSLATIGLWSYFIAWTTGFPPKMAASLHRLAPNTVPWVEPSLLVCTALVTAIWFAIVIWRLRRRPKALWRGPWLAALGITLIWTVGTALFSQMLDKDRSHTTAAREVAGKLRIFGYLPGDCVRSDGLPLSLKGLVAYSGIRFSDSTDCRYTVSRIGPGEPIPADKIGIPTSYHRGSEFYVIRPGDASPINSGTELNSNNNRKSEK